MNVNPTTNAVLVLLPLRPVQAYAQSRSCNAKVPPTGIRWHPVVRYHIFRTVHTIVGAGSVDSFVLCGDDVQQQLTSVIMSSTSSEWSALHDYIACGTDRRFWLETVSFPCFDGFWSLVRATMSDSYEYPSGSESCVNSTLNSLDFWDYTIELECLRQPSGIWSS